MYNETCLNRTLNNTCLFQTQELVIGLFGLDRFHFSNITFLTRGRCGGDRMVVWFTTTKCTYAISVYQGQIKAMCTTLCDKVCQWLATCLWFSPGPPVSSTNKTDHHDITELLLKVALKTIRQTNKQTNILNYWWR